MSFIRVFYESDDEKKPLIISSKTKVFSQSVGWPAQIHPRLLFDGTELNVDLLLDWEDSCGLSQGAWIIDL